jgi:valyl-tRNA synthetase
MNVVPSRRAKVYIETKYQDSFAPSTHAFFARLASASEVEVAASFDSTIIDGDSAVQIITDSATIYLPLADLVDTEKERARLEGEMKKLTDEIDRVQKKLSNESFVSKAPAAVVDAERGKLAKYQENLDGVKAALAKLK